MKRSRHIHLVLLGTLSTGGLTACGPGPETPVLSVEQAYPNNHHLGPVGYYHAPFRSWFGRPYNQYDASSGLYFAGGEWLKTPHQSITNISKPTPEAVRMAQGLIAAQSQVSRGGFGHSSGFRSGYS